MPRTRTLNLQRPTNPRETETDITVFYVHPSPNPPRYYPHQANGTRAINWGVWCSPRHDSEARPICVQDGYTSRADAQTEADRLNA